MLYQRFRLLLTPGYDGSYTVQALTPMGEGWARFEPPRFASQAVSFPAPRESLRDLIQNGNASEWPEDTGEQLFEALFQGEVLRLYERSLDLATAHAETGLRIELTFDPRNPELALVQMLPWELLRQPGTSRFLALSRRTSITRFLAVPLPVRAALRPEALRILAVAANQGDPDREDPKLPRLDLDAELRNLQEAAGPAAQVIPVAPTLDALCRALGDHECHVLHFMGHGGSPKGRNVLLFVKDGMPDPVTGTDLANTLADFPSLRLVVLNACGSGRVQVGGKDFDPYSGVANALVLGGIPAVIAMARPIFDDTAVTFSRVFYQRFAAGLPVDVAVTEGRRAVHAEHRRELEWATPILFMRTPTGELYPEKDLWDPPLGKKRPARWGIAAALLLLLLGGGTGLALCNWRVERLVAEGAALAGQDQWSSARERFQAAHLLAPGSAEILLNLAGADEKLGDLGAAEDHYREAARKQPDSAEHLYNLGCFLNGRQSYDEAYRILLQAAERDPRRADIHAELAQAAVRLGMPGRARIHLEVALRLDPGLTALFKRLGELELDTGNPRAAIPHLNEALRRYPLGDLGRVETTWLLARAYDWLGNTSSACRQIHELHHLDPPGITPWAQEAEAMRSRLSCGET